VGVLNGYEEEMKRKTKAANALPKAQLRVRISSSDAHYGGGLLDGAHVLQLFGDLATELTIRHDGDEGLLRAYEMVELLAPVYAGDYLEARGEITAVGNTSRRMTFEAWKVIQAGGPLPSSAHVLEPPLLVARATGVSVVPKERQRGRKRR